MADETKNFRIVPEKLTLNLTPRKNGEVSSKKIVESVRNSHSKNLVKKAKLSLQKKTKAGKTKKIVRQLIHSDVDLNETDDFKDGDKFGTKFKSRCEREKIPCETYDTDKPGIEDSEGRCTQCPTCNTVLQQDKLQSHIPVCLKQFSLGNSKADNRAVNQTDEQYARFLQEREKENHEEGIPTGEELYICQICQKNLSQMNSRRRAQHTNQCIDAEESQKKILEEEKKALEEAKRAVLDCPMCGQHLKTSNARNAHLKRCALRLGVSTDEMMKAVKMQEQERQNKVAAGILPFINRQTRRQGGDIDQSKKLTRRKPRGDKLDEDTQLAIALSTSLVEQQKKQEEMLTGHLNLHVDYPPVDNAESRKEGKKGRKKKKVDEAPPLLLQLSSAEAQTRIANRVTELLLPQEQEEEVDSTPPVHVSRLTCLPGAEVFSSSGRSCQKKYGMVWSRTAQCDPVEDLSEIQSQYYVLSLMPPVEMCKVTAGSKLRRISEIPGRRQSAEKEIKISSFSMIPDREKSTEKGSVDNSNSSVTVPMVSTQTAVVLAELAAEGEDMLVSSVSPGDDDLADLTQASGFCPESPVMVEIDPNHSTAQNLQASLLKLVNDVKFSDVAITTRNGTKISAHKIFLAARCPNLLEMVNVETNTIDLADVSKEAMLCLLRFVYSGSVHLQSSILEEVTQLAKRFALTDFYRICETAADKFECNDFELSKNENLQQIDPKYNRESSVDDLLKTMWSDSDFDEGQGDVQSGQEVRGHNEDDEGIDQTEWREIFCSQRQKLKEQTVSNSQSVKLKNLGENEDKKDIESEIKLSSSENLLLESEICSNNISRVVYSVQKQHKAILEQKSEDNKSNLTQAKIEQSNVSDEELFGDGDLQTSPTIPLTVDKIPHSKSRKLDETDECILYSEESNHSLVEPDDKISFRDSSVEKSVSVELGESTDDNVAILSGGSENNDNSESDKISKTFLKNKSFSFGLSRGQLGEDNEVVHHLCNFEIGKSSSGVQEESENISCEKMLTDDIPQSSDFRKGTQDWRLVNRQEEDLPSLHNISTLPKPDFVKRKRSSSGSDIFTSPAASQMVDLDKPRSCKLVITPMKLPLGKKFKISTPLDSAALTKQHSYMEQDSLLITPVTNQRSTFMLETPVSCEELSRNISDEQFVEKATYVATPIGRLIPGSNTIQLDTDVNLAKNIEMDLSDYENNLGKTTPGQRKPAAGSSVSNIHNLQITNEIQDKFESTNESKNKSVSTIENQDEFSVPSEVDEDVNYSPSSAAEGWESDSPRQKKLQVTSVHLSYKKSRILPQESDDSDLEIIGDNLEELASQHKQSPKFQPKYSFKRVSSKNILNSPKSMFSDCNKLQKTKENMHFENVATVETCSPDKETGETKETDSWTSPLNMSSPETRQHETEGSLTVHSGPSSPVDDVWEGFDEFDAACPSDMFCDVGAEADAESSPEKLNRLTQKRRHSKVQPQESDDSLPSPTIPVSYTSSLGEKPGSVHSDDSFVWDEAANCEPTEDAEAAGVAQKAAASPCEASNFKTPLIKKKKVWVPPSPFTPMPHYEQMTTPELKNRVQNYGVRPVGKKRMILLMKDIYHQTHQYETDSDYEKEQEVEHTKLRGQKKDGKKTSKPVHKGKSTSESDERNDTVSSSQESVYSDMPEESFLVEDDEVMSSQSEKSELHQKLLKFILDNSDIHTRMVMYEPLELDWLKKKITESGIKLSMQKLRDFLDEKCITFTMKKMSKRNTRRRPARKKKANVPNSAL